MLDAFLEFNRGLMAQPWRVQLWVTLLMAVNLLVPLAYLGRVEARVTLVAFVCSAIAMTLVTRTTGFSRLLGLGHAPWIPLLAWLVTRLDGVPAVDAYGTWLRVLIVLNTVSLIIDGSDVVRWLGGERGDLGADGEAAPNPAQLSPSK